MQIFRVSVLAFFILFLNSCISQDAEELTIYFNDYESDEQAYTAVDTAYSSYDQISEVFSNFNKTRTLGRFGTGGLTLNIEGIEEHQWIRISFDFYVHDKWEGNGLRGNGQDVMILNIDKRNVYFSSIVNTKCQTYDCEEIQSFPNRIGEGNNKENAGIEDPSLPGVCFYKDEIGGSKLIRYTEVFQHTSTNLEINIAAGIKDAGPDLCLKSWSIDNMKISTISLPE